MGLPSKDSAVVRSLRVVLFTALAFLGSLLVMPEFAELVREYYPEAVPVISALAGFVTLVVNLLRPNVKNWN